MNIFQLKENTIKGYKTMIEIVHPVRKTENYITIHYHLGGKDKVVVLDRTDKFFMQHGLVVSDILVDDNGDFVSELIADWDGLDKEEKQIELCACNEWDHNPMKQILKKLDNAATFPLLVRFCRF